MSPPTSEQSMLDQPADGGGEPAHGNLPTLALGALGIVYGDIGTSPLYAVKECFQPAYGIDPVPSNILGILSLFIWALVLVIVVKYITFVMRADNNGEGGILALFALVVRSTTEKSRKAILPLLMLGLFGAALLYGDGMITPAISVLSAMEGLEVATSALKPFVVPITIGILLLLFMVQRKGTHKVARIFGPTMLLWFVCIAMLGIVSVVQAPQILMAFNPLHGVRLLIHHGVGGFLVLGAVVLCITGGEALYADMGHFGRRPIRLAWYAVAMPALLLNYLGQGALLLRHGDYVANPFYALVPAPLLYPMVALATAATVIASQALISGAFSLTQQAVQLGYWPRVAIIHTSGDTEGQIYVPEINWALMVSCIALVIGFQESTRLAAAYGIAVTGTMAITSLLFYVVARDRWEWPRWKTMSVVGAFLAVDVVFFSANVPKITHGGWFPLVIGAIVFTMMTTWQRGRAELSRVFAENTMPADLFLLDLETSRPIRVPGTAVFMTSSMGGIPMVLLHHFKHNKVLHEQVVLLSIVTEKVPIVSGKDRVEVTPMGQGFFRVIAHYGFMQLPSTTKALQRCRMSGLNVNVDQTSFYLGRETLLVTGRGKMARWRKILFAFLARNSRPATSFFGLPPNRVVEMGAQIEL